jgi:hypothetical protein
VSARTLITSLLRTLLYGRPPSPDTIGQWGYLDQTKTWGIRLPYYHFTQAHLFDLLHGTDTRLAVLKNSYTETPAGFENGTFYTPSWTSEIKASYGIYWEVSLINTLLLTWDAEKERLCSYGNTC